jgi:hypothetical protein
MAPATAEDLPQTCPTGAALGHLSLMRGASPGGNLGATFWNQSEPAQRMLLKSISSVAFSSHDLFSRSPFSISNPTQPLAVSRFAFLRVRLAPVRREPSIVQSQGIDTNAKTRVQKFLGQADGTLKPEAKKAQGARQESQPSPSSNEAPTWLELCWNLKPFPHSPQKMEHTPP